MIKHQLLIKLPELLSHLPETHWLTASKAIRMLKSHSSIFLKPNRGSGGTGIIRIRKRTLHDGYEFRYGRYRKYVSSSSMQEAVRTYEKSHKHYIVQRGIDIARYKGKRFDLRVYLQKLESGWTISGIVARIAAPRLVVTNHRQGGYARTLEKVLTYIFDGDQSKVHACEEEIKSVAMTTAQALDKRFTDIRELGIDIGIDINGRVWFIEANSRPAHHLFTQLSDKSMLRKIRENKRKLHAHRYSIIL